MLVGEECRWNRSDKIVINEPWASLSEIRIHKVMQPWILLPGQDSVISRNSINYPAGLCEEPHFKINLRDAEGAFISHIDLQASDSNFIYLRDHFVEG